MNRMWFAERHAGDSRHLDFEEQEYWEGSGEELEMHGDDEEADMRTQEELMMQHRYMMVSHPPTLPTPSRSSLPQPALARGEKGSGMLLYERPMINMQTDCKWHACFMVVSLPSPSLQNTCFADICASGWMLPTVASC